MYEPDRQRALPETNQLLANQPLEEHHLGVPASLVTFRDISNSRKRWSSYGLPGCT